MFSAKPVLTIILAFCAIPSVLSKIYSRCELAQELRDVHGIPESQLATWMCIIWHESSFNTSALSPGSESYGLFQISKEFWCSPRGRGCGIPCSALRDDDIRDDVNCAKYIFGQSSKISGDGFKAWTLYQYRCKTNVGRYLKGCFGGTDAYVSAAPQYKTFSNYVPVPKRVQTYSKANENVGYRTAKGYSFKWNRNGFRLVHSEYRIDAPVGFVY